MSDEWTDKLDHIIGLVLQHVYQDESSWFAELVESKDGDQTLQTKKFTEHFDRYMGDKAALFG